MANIRAATISEASRSSGEWVFVDLGFASEAKSCGLLVGDVNESEAKTLSFSQLKTEILSLCNTGTAPLNLLLEAPLSVAFGPNGNPVGRSVERRNGQTRYWYVGLGCSVLVAATYLLRSMHDLPVHREIRLFEGLVSFKPKGIPSSHTQDVIALREVVWSHDASRGRVVPPEELASKQGDRVVSAFQVAGMDFGVPPVVAVGA
ncbi:MAG: hypothetical protein K2X06_07815 [Burkholderiales bacterium]|nr:hypothetical protein [Burkholderiales bacterium]